MRPLLVGEDNPYSLDPRFALYPHPRNSAGGRLCFDVMRLSIKDYIRGFERVNLCERQRWDDREARESFVRIWDMPDRTIILLGAKVCGAFGLRYEPFKVISECFRHKVIILPHPSGRNRVWNEPGASNRAESILVQAGILPLPPWPPKDLPRKADGELLELLPSTTASTRRPAWCSNCHLIVRGETCPECGPIP